MGASILFVCHGNICRSPMAEFIMKDILAKRGFRDGFHIESCATSDEEIGSDIYPPAKAELERRGIASEHRCARRIVNEDYGRFDYIIVMDRQNLRNLKRFVGGDPQNRVSMLMRFAGENREIADPWYTGDLSGTYDDLYRACSALADLVTGGTVRTPNIP